MGKFKAMIAAALLSQGACAFAQGAPMGAAELARMRTIGPKVAPMLAACGANSSMMEALRALEARGAKATVFVSAAALEDRALVSILARRRDLFEPGNLGAACQARGPAMGNLKQNFVKKTSESADDVKAMKSLAEDIILGSRAIESRLGSKPRFFAFGKDFADVGYDPFEQGRLVVGIADYLDKPTPESRYDAFAKSKAVFGSWVLLVKLDRTGAAAPAAGKPGPGAAGALTQKSVEEKLGKMPKNISTAKASEAWVPSMRGPLAREVEVQMRAQAERRAAR